MKEIPLTQGKVALVDDEDFQSLSAYKWFAYKSFNTWYAARSVMVGVQKQKNLGMHRQILRLQFGDGVVTDHWDGNGLNNQRYNIRICSTQQNMRNRRTISGPKSSRFKGVTCYRHCTIRPWMAQILVPGAQRRCIGYFRTEEVAALAYNEAAKLHFKEFAKLNVF